MMSTQTLESTPTWIGSICRRFTDATGWPLRFDVEGSSRLNAITFRGESYPSTCWSADVTDGDHRLGCLWMDLPQDASSDRSFLAICEMAEIIVGLINEISTASKTLDSQSEDVSTLVDVGLVIHNEENLLRALTQLLRAVVHLTGFRAADFFLLNESAEQLTLRAHYELESMTISSPHRNLCDSPPDLEAMSSGKFLLASSSFPESSRWLPEGAQTALCHAVQSEDGPIGTLWLYDRRSREPDDRTWHVLESIAAQISTILERVMLLQESRSQYRIQQDLKVASDSQEYDIIGVLPANCGFDAAAVNSSRFELGGDLCELVSIDQHRTVVAVGDASGDSVPAAMVMSAVRGALRTLLVDSGQDFERTELVMQRLNKALTEITPAHQFMSLVYGVVNTSDGTFTYTNAGHPRPVHFKQNEELDRLESHGMLLGVSSEAVYGHSVIEFSVDDILILFTDGISEAMSRSRTMFRQDGIVNAVQGHKGESAETILNAIWSSLETHVGDDGEGDDRTLLVMKMQAP